jgi:hydroxylamine reductase (hybrid-cluster protein)
MVLPGTFTAYCQITVIYSPDKNLMLQGTKAALADGWGGSMIATELQDVMFGTPAPVASQN